MRIASPRLWQGAMTLHWLQATQNSNHWKIAFRSYGCEDRALSQLTAAWDPRHRGPLAAPDQFGNRAVRGAFMTAFADMHPQFHCRLRTIPCRVAGSARLPSSGTECAR